jgi:hypothetical protein
MTYPIKTLILCAIFALKCILIMTWHIYFVYLCVRFTPRRPDSW